MRELRTDTSEQLLDPQLSDRRGQKRDRALGAAMASGTAVRLLCIASQFVAVAVAARALGDVRFGLLATLTTMLGLLAFADLGIGAGLMTDLAVTTGREDLHRARVMISSAICGMAVLGAAIAVVGVAAAIVVPWHEILGAAALPRSEVTASMAVFFLCAGAAVPAGLGQRILIGMQEGMLANLWLLAGALTSLASVIVMVQFPLPLWCFALGTLGCPPLIAAVGSLWALRRHPQLRPRWRLVTVSSLRSLAGVSGLFFVLNVAVAVAYQSDVVIVASTLGAGAAGVFAVTARMFSALTGTLTAASQQVWTSMAEAMARGDAAWVRSRFSRVVTGTLAVSVPAATALIVIGQPVAERWVGPQFRPPTTLLVAFAAWAVYSLAMTQVGFLLNAAQIVRPQVVMALSMTTVNVAVSLYLTHHIGIAGPLVGSLIAHTACSGIPSVMLALRVLRRLGPTSEVLR